MYQNLPRELRDRNAWVTWRYEVEPGKVKPTKPLFNPNTGILASSTDPATWAPFDKAVKVANNGGGYNGIGYVVSDDDPYTFIDLDTYDPKLTDADRIFHNQIAQAFQGYAELSPSGQGLHLIVKGKIPAGIKRRGVEIYSNARYMTCTGNVWRQGEILPQEQLLYQLWADLNGAPDETEARADQPESSDDTEICNRAANAINGALFKSLYLGQWQAQYPSQSEADFALIDILAFYTQNRQQITRIFRASALGKREKASRAKYIAYMLNKAFDNQPPPVDVEKLKANIEAMMAAKLAAQAGDAVTTPQTPAVDTTPQLSPATPTPVATVPASAVTAADDAQANEVYSVPPGLLGDLARYIYQSSPRPVAEIALSGAIGLMSGICGRSYNINGTGLNQYLLMLAPTGSGKESVATGIAHLMNAVQRHVPAAMDFIGPGEISSPQALIKYLSKKSPSFVTISGEFGHMLSMMARPNAPTHLLGIKRMMLDLYGKSGQGSILRPTIYSDSDKNTMSLASPAFSFVGESAPESFYESVTEQLVADGLLPRFTIIEYTGPRPALNSWAGFEPPKELIDQLAQLCVQSLMLNNAHKALTVNLMPDAKKLLDEFEISSTAAINSQESREVTRHIWNRAHLRSLKLAALVATGLNPYQPTVDLFAAQWAIRLSSYNTKKLLDRFDRGEIGSGATDDKHVSEVTRVLKDYVYKSWYDAEPYSEHEQLWKQRIVPYQYINKRLAATSAFRLDRRGATAALHTALKTLIDNGVIVELAKQDVFSRYGLSLRCFAITSLKAIEKGR